MIGSLRDLPDNSIVETDLCIIGAGAAGITIARAFIGSSIQVLLLESGDLEFEPDTQALYEGENVGLPYFDLDAARLRYFGGSTNHWEGWCTPMAEIDFLPRPWVPYSGWPLTLSDLDAYYRQAQTICQLAPYAYDGDSLWPVFDVEPLPFSPEQLAVQFWQSSPPTYFGETYRAPLEDARNVRVLLNANVTELVQADNAASIRHLTVRSLEGKQAEVRAKRYVLACGAIENARLLLNSTAVEANGVGNGHDLVGRFFMEHPHIRAGTVITDESRDLLRRFSGFHRDGIKHLAGLCPAPALQRQEQILNASLTFYYRADIESGVEAARQIFWHVRNGEVPSEFGTLLWRVVRDFTEVVPSVYGRYVTGEEPLPAVKEVYLFARSEQAPNPDSRVLLSGERDALGLRRVQLDWRLTELDRRTIAAATKAVGGELGRLDLGRVRLEDWLGSDTAASGQDALPGGWGADLQGGFHQMGTTRMSADPKQGVVDGDCRMHGVENLFIAGSSVFTTGGYANPTLTIVALALRLADHLKRELA